MVAFCQEAGCPWPGKLHSLALQAGFPKLGVPFWGVPIIGLGFRVQGFRVPGFPKIGGTILGVPIIRITTYWGLDWGLVCRGTTYLTIVTGSHVEA